MELNGNRYFSTFVYRQAFTTLASCLIPLCSGVTLGIPAVVLPQLREDKSITYNPAHESWIASISTLSIIAGSIGSGHILDCCGRKAAHLIVAVPFLIGWIIIACANSTSIIIVGRFITGLASSGNRVVTMAYIAEITDPKFRSVALFTPGLTMLLGILFSHIFGYYMYWKTSSVLCILSIIISLIAFLFLKESPFWLIAKGRIDEGVENFRWFRGSNDTSEAELKVILDRQSNKPEITAKEILNAVKTKAFIKPVLILVVVVLNIQLSGVNVLCFYALDVFKKVFKGNVDPFVIMIIIDCIRVSVTIGICGFGKAIPRKIAFLTSNFCITGAVIGLVACFLTNYGALWVSVLCLVIYICFASVVVSIGWTFVPELLPNSARGLGSGFISALSFLLLFAMVKTTPDVLYLYGEAVMFSCYGVSTLLCGLILCFALPNTNGRTLQSIEDSYKNKNVEDDHPVQG